IAELESVGLVIGVEAQRRPGKRGVVGEPDAVRGQETAGPSSQMPRLIRQPVLERGDAGVATARLASQLPVGRPVRMPEGNGDIRIHQEVACRVEARRIDAEVSGPQLRADADRVPSVTERAEQELVLAPRRAGTAALAECGQLLPRERPTVRRQQAASGRRKVAPRATHVLTREEDGLGGYAAGGGEKRERGESDRRGTS